MRDRGDGDVEVDVERVRGMKALTRKAFGGIKGDNAPTRVRSW